MTIKSETKEPDHVSTFPALYKSLESELVVLFNSKFTGMVVVPRNQCHIHAVGDYSSTYTDCFDTETWERLPTGTQIILTQQ